MEAPPKLSPHLRALTLALGALLSVSCKAKPHGIQATTTVDLKPCRLHPYPREVLCTTVETPRDPKDPKAGTLPLAVSILPAWGTRSKDPKPPLFILAGGPGQAARDAFPNYASLLKNWSKTRDIVLVDIRGTGDSDPLDCSPPEVPDLSKGYQAQLAQSLKALKACRDSMGERHPRHYTTPQNADDLDAVRAALGYETISLFGASYGTRLAMEYARRHADHTHRLVLDGVAPVELALPWFSAQTFERAWNKISDYCLADAACKARFPKVRSSIRTLLDKLEKEPQAPVSIKHSSRDLRFDFLPEPDSIREMLFSPSYVPLFWTLLPLAIDKAIQGEWEPLFALGDHGGKGMEESVHMLLFYSIVCNEDWPQWKDKSVDPAMKQGLMSDLFLRTYNEICPLFQSGRPTPKSYYQAIESEKPTLFLSGDADPVTPPEWAKKIQPNFPNSVEITVPYTGHNTIETRCIQTIVNHFLDDQDPLTVDTSCVKDTRLPYFFTSVNGPSQAFSAAQIANDEPPTTQTASETPAPTRAAQDNPTPEESP